MGKITTPNKVTGGTFSATEYNEIKTVVNELDDAVVAAQTGAASAQTAADSAISAASTADGKAVQALADAATADGKAVQAQDDATQALGDAAIAMTSADNAATAAAVADGKAVAAQASATAADAKATQALSDAAAALAAAGGNSFQVLTDNSTVVWEMAEGNVAELTIQGNRTLAVNGTVNGDSGVLLVTQGGAGNFNLTVTGLKSSAFQLSLGSGEKTLLSFVNINGVLVWDYTLYGTAGQYDTDSENYFNYLDIQNAGITTNQKDSINELVVWMKTEGLYNFMFDFWLIPSATNKTVAKRGFKGNLMGSTLDATAWTISAAGIKGGTTVVDLGISPSVIGTGNHQISVYINSLGAAVGYQIGTCSANSTIEYSYISARSNALYVAMSGAGTGDEVTINPLTHANGLFTATKIGGTLNVVRNGVVVSSAATSTQDTLSVRNYTLGGLNASPPSNFSDSTFSFVSIGTVSMTTAQAAAYYTKVQAVQAAFNRAV